MCDYYDDDCPDCGGTDGNHYPGCTYEGTSGGGGYYRGSSGGNMSTFAAVNCTVGGLIGAAALVALFTDDVESVPVGVIILLWIIIGSVLAVIISGRK